MTRIIKKTHTRKHEFSWDMGIKITSTQINVMKGSEDTDKQGKYLLKPKKTTTT